MTIIYYFHRRLPDILPSRAVFWWNHVNSHGWWPFPTDLYRTVPNRTLLKIDPLPLFFFSWVRHWSEEIFSCHDEWEFIENSCFFQVRRGVTSPNSISFLWFLLHSQLPIGTFQSKNISFLFGICCIPLYSHWWIWSSQKRFFAFHNCRCWFRNLT